MRTIMLAVSAAIFLLPSSAQAARSVPAGNVTQFCGDRVCPAGLLAPIQIKRTRQPRRVAYVRRGGKALRAKLARSSGGRDGCRSGVGALSCVVAPLGAKAREIVSACGSQVVSAVAGRPNRSNHPIGRAVDLVGNPACIYSHLKGWPGGYSTDYGRVHHVHISYNPGGQEWGVRFAHGGHRHTRHARRGVPKYATALPPE